MKSRYSSLVNVKKNSVQSSEQAVQAASIRLENAKRELQNSFEALQKIETPLSGKINSFLSNRALLEAQRAQIEHNQEWVAFASKELEATKENLLSAMREYEKFHYLEHKEIQDKLKHVKRQEAKELDEVALIAHARKNKISDRSA